MMNLNVSKEKLEDEIVSANISLLDIKDCCKRCVDSNNKEDYLILLKRVATQEKVIKELEFRLSMYV